MSRNRLSLILAAAAIVIIAVGGFFLGVQPQLATAATNTAQRAQIEQTNAGNRMELDRLRGQFARLGTMKARLDVLRGSVPDHADTAEFIRALDVIAQRSGVKVSTVNVADAQAYEPPAAPGATTASPATGTSAATASPSATPSAAPSAAATPAAPTAPTVLTDPLITGEDFAVIPVSIGVDGTYDQALAFVKGIQDGERLFLINTVTSSASEDATSGPTETWTFGGFIYVLSKESADPTAATTAGSATASATPSATAANG